MHFVASGIFHPEPGGPATYLHHLLPDFRHADIRSACWHLAMHPPTGYPYPLRRIPRRTLPVRMAGLCAARPGRKSAEPTLCFINSLGLPLIGAGRKPRVLKVVGDLAWERAVNKGWIPATEDIDHFQHGQYDWRVRLIQAQRAREVRRMDQIIVPSRYLREMVIGWGAAPERVQVIYNALAPNAPTSTISPAEARAPLGWTRWSAAADGSPAGSLERDRPPDPRGSRSCRTCGCSIAGDGPDESHLRALAESERVADRVTFLGSVPRERLALIYRAVDYTVLYSGYEGLSHSLLESLLAGTPVIASDKGGNPEVVRHGENGLLVPYVDVDALTDTIRAALDGETRARLAAHTGDDLDRFGWETMVNATIELLESQCMS